MSFDGREAEGEDELSPESEVEKNLTQKQKEQTGQITTSMAVELIEQFMKRHSLQPVTWEQVLEWEPFPEGPIQYSREQWDCMLNHFKGEELLYSFTEGGLHSIYDMPTIKIRDLGVRYSNKLIAVVGQVIGVSELKPDWGSINYRCENCNKVHTPPDAKNPSRPPKKCLNCEEKEFDTVFDETGEIKNMQGITLQEGPLSLSCVIAGREVDMWKVTPGQKAYVVGVLKFEAYYNKQTHKPDFRKYLKLLCAEPLTNKEIIVTQKDIDRFREIVKDPLFYQFLIASYAPFIYGLEEQKEVCVFVLGSQGIPRPNNGLLCGPPARAKTELVKYTVRLSHNGNYKAFTNVSVPGLTSATEQDPNTGIRLNKPGLFATSSLVGLTELQAIKRKEDVKVSLNDVLENKEVASAKAEGSYNLKANCAVLIDTNNYAASWDYESRIAHNLQFMEPNLHAFLSRMDLISISPKIQDKKVLRQIAYSSFDSYRESTDPIETHLEDWTDPLTNEPRYGFNTLRKYFYYVTQMVALPPLSKELREQFADFYEEANENSSEFLVDGRYNRQMAINARIRARLLLKAEADCEDLEEARRIVNASKFVVTRTGVIDVATGKEELDGNVTVGVESKSSIKRNESKDRQFMEAITYTMTQKVPDGHEPRTYFTIADILYYFKIKGLLGWDQHEVEKIIQRWMNVNKLHEMGAPGGGRYAL